MNNIQPYRLLVVCERQASEEKRFAPHTDSLFLTPDSIEGNLEKEDLDIIVVDESIDFKESVKISHQTRTSSRHSATPLVLIAPDATSEMMTEAIEEGIDCVLFNFPSHAVLESLARSKRRRMQAALHDTTERYETFKKHIVHGFSHEFRTPLTAVSVGTELLRERLLQAADPLIFSLLETISRGSERLKHTVQEFVSIQQIVSGAAQELSIIRRQVLSAKETLGDMKQVLKQILASRLVNVTFADDELEFGSEESKIKACKSHLYDIASQLAFHLASVCSTEQDLLVRGSIKERVLELHIKDSGKNAHERWANSILPLFESLERRAKSEPGRGVELAVAAHLCEINGGSLSVHHRTDESVLIIARFSIGGE